MIPAAFILAAQSVNKVMKNRIMFLEEFIHSLEIMSRELETRARALPTLMSMLSDGRTDACGQFYQRMVNNMDRLGDCSFSQLWKETAETFFSVPERSTVMLLGESLGRFELKAQVSAINAAADELYSQLNGLKTQYSEKSRLNIGLYSALGIMITIVLL